MTIQDRHLLIGSEILLWLAGLNVLDACFGILFEHYFDCYKRRCEQRYGEKSDDPSKKTNHSGLTFHFHRKFFLFVSDIDKRTNLADKPIRLSGKIFRLFYPLLGKLFLSVRNFKKVGGNFASLFCETNSKGNSRTFTPAFSVRGVCCDEVDKAASNAVRGFTNADPAENSSRSRSGRYSRTAKSNARNGAWRLP
jgi:hypothetical protein